MSPSKGNVFRSFEVILNFVLQVTLEGVVFHWACVLGIALLLAAVGMAGFETEVTQRLRGRIPWL